MKYQTRTEYETMIHFKDHLVGKYLPHHTNSMLAPNVFDPYPLKKSTICAFAA